MSDGVVLSPDAFERTKAAVRRVERMFPGAGREINDGRYHGPIQPAIITDVLIIGDALSDDSGSGSGGGSGGNKTCRPIYPAMILQWDECDHYTTDFVWAFELNDDPLIYDRKYPARVIMHDFRTDPDDPSTEATLVQVYRGGFASESDQGSGSGNSRCGGLAPKDLIDCPSDSGGDGMAQVADGCLKLVDPTGKPIADLFIALMDADNQIIAGGPQGCCDA